MLLSFHKGLENKAKDISKVERKLGGLQCQPSTLCCVKWNSYYSSSCIRDITSKDFLYQSIPAVIHSPTDDIMKKLVSSKDRGGLEHPQETLERPGEGFSGFDPKLQPLKCNIKGKLHNYY